MDRLTARPGLAVRPARLTAATLAAAGLAASAFGPGGPQGLFLVGLATLLALAACAAFLGGTPRARAATLGAGGALAGALLLVAGAAVGGAAAAALLALALSAAVAGLAAFGRAWGASTAGAGAGALLTVALATTGLFWADPVAERLPPAARRAFRQAVLDLDPATALAYDAAGFDRLLHPPIYAHVPLASSTFRAPRAVPCALAWGALGAALGLAAALARRGGVPASAA